MDSVADALEDFEACGRDLARHDDRPTGPRNDIGTASDDQGRAGDGADVGRQGMLAKRGGRIGESYWDVLKGPMLFIFIVDAVMTVLNFSCAGLLLV